MKDPIWQNKASLEPRNWLLFFTLTSLVTLTSTAQTISHVVKQGDNMSQILNKYHVASHDVQAYMALHKNNPFAHQIKPGDKIDIALKDNNVTHIHITQPHSKITLDRTQAGFDYIEQISAHPTTRKYAHFTVKHSLYRDGIKAGAPSKAIMTLPDVFSWDIDFKRDITPGTQITLIYEDKHTSSPQQPIVMARIKNKKNSWEAIRFVNKSGDTSYVSPNGHSMQRDFLKYPLKFRRISSGFSSNRHHPMLNIKRPHYGVDFAANKGTPVVSTSSGKIIYQGWKGGYGKTVVVQHTPRYKTVYAHLNHFPKTTKKGKKVERGQVIGYVGNTGHSTGPHLHYEFHDKNIPRDPLRVSMPRSYHLNTKDLAIVAAERQQCLAMLSNASLS